MKKISNSKPVAEPSEPSKTVEQGSRTNESSNGKNTDELTVGTMKEIEVLENVVVENYKEESRATANQGKKRKFPSREEEKRKRKFPSREEISRAR